MEKQKRLVANMDKTEEKNMRKIGDHYRRGPGVEIMVENRMTLAAARLEAGSEGT